MKFGIYRQERLDDVSQLAAMEQELGARISFLSFFRAWNGCRMEDDLPWLRRITSSDREILLTWEPWQIPPDPHHPQIQPAFALSEIVSGRYERYVRDFAAALRDLGREIYLRPMHEMNGCWYPWCGTVNGNCPGDFVRAWKYLRTLFAEVGASNVTWVWSPYGASFPDIPSNSVETYFPGEEEIDWGAIDAYNWGTGTGGERWQTFPALIQDAYDSMALLTGKPIMIAEVACAEEGGSKACWIREMGEALPRLYPSLDVLIWFDMDKERDWRLASSAGSLEAFRNCLATHFPACQPW